MSGYNSSIPQEINPHAASAQIYDQIHHRLLSIPLNDKFASPTTSKATYYTDTTVIRSTHPHSYTSRPDIVQANDIAKALNTYQPSKSRFIVEESDSEFRAEVNWDHRPPVESQNDSEWLQQYEDPGSPLKFESPPTSLPRRGGVQFDFLTNTTYTTTMRATSPSASPQQQQARGVLTLEGSVPIGANGSPIS